MPQYVSSELVLGNGNAKLPPLAGFNLLMRLVFHAIVNNFSVI